MLSFAELTDVAEPAWPTLWEGFERCPVDVEVLEPDSHEARRAVEWLQTSAESPSGALALHTGGVLIDHGWLRVLGSGVPARGLIGLAPAAPETPSAAEAPTLLVAYDVLGGVYEVNGADPEAAGRPGVPGEVLYYAPEQVAWTRLDTGFSYRKWLAFLAWGGTTDFYGDQRWPGWEQETAALRLDQGLSFYPPLSTAEARADPASTSRRPVGDAELLGRPTR